MIVSVAGYKGGIGKTTTAVHLAAFFQSLSPTLLIDADENRSAQAWARLEKLPFEVITENQAPRHILSMRPEHMIIDTKARPSPEDIEEISQNCDLLILPSTTRPMDLEVLVKTVHGIRNIKTPFCVLLTMVPPTSTKISADIKEVLYNSKIPVFETSIQKYAFVEQLPLDGVLAKDSKDENALKVWEQFMQLGREIMA